MMTTLTQSAVCLGCGCTCDDLELRRQDTDCDTGSLEVRNACQRGESWFATGQESGTVPAWIDGQPASLDEAVQLAGAWLADARRPLITGLEESTLEAQRQAIHLAETLGGVIDSATSHAAGPIHMASQLVGKSTCTLGEVRNRADLILCWGVNPVVTHPRLLERYTPRTPGACAILMVDSAPQETRVQADSFLAIPPDSDFEILTAMRAMLQNRRVDASLLSESGVSIEQLQQLLDRMRQARYGVLFFSGLLARSSAAQQMTAAAIFTLTAALNRQTRFSAIPLRQPGNAVGLDQVLTWTTGYPFGVDFSRGYPRSNATEFTTQGLLSRQETDALLIVGRVPATWSSVSTRIPTVAVSSHAACLQPVPRVQITTAANAVAGEGTISRMDGVPLPLRMIQPSAFPSESHVLQRIREAVQAR